MNVKSRIILYLLAHLSVCGGFKILIAIPTTIRSLHGMFSHIAVGLAKAGHEVTFITPYVVNEKPQNLVLCQTSQFIPMLEKFKIFHIRKLSNFSAAIDDMLPSFTKVLWSDERVMEVWKERQTFDLFITMSYYSEITFPFLMNTSTSFVQVCTPGVEAVSLSYEGNWLTPAVVPSILNDYDEYMTFWERVLNLPGTIAYNLLQRSMFKKHTQMLREFFPDFGSEGSYYDRVALTLINGHFALDGPVPLLPSQIEIGTINAKKPQPLEKLDKKLAKFVEDSGDAGIVYFSLGSIAKGTDIPKDAKDKFLEAFRRIPQRVLWKYEGDDLDLPPNVMTQKWMPQQDILGHPKTRVFISHCGNLGTQEAKYHGVPVLGVPIAFDQPRNAARMARKGYALVINWEDLSVDNILEKLNILINDKSYKERLSTISRILQDQKDTPLERAIWWLEYVVRHKGAPHLNYAGRRLSLFQYIMLDVLLFWFAVLAAIVLVVVFTIRALCCRKSSKRGVVSQKKKQH